MMAYALTGSDRDPDRKKDPVFCAASRHLNRALSALHQA
jgi:hypothetical protein